VGGLNTGSNVEYGARLSPDETTVYFSRSPIATANDGGVRMYYATRASTMVPFSGPSVVLTTGEASEYPTVTADGKDMIFNKPLTPPASPAMLKITTRPNASSAWGTPGFVGSLNGPGAGPSQGYLTRDGGRLYYAYNGLFVATKQGATYTGATSVMSTPVGESYSNPIVTDDELTLYFARSVGAGTARIHRATRASVTDAWGSITEETALNGQVPAAPTWISSDRCALYMSAAHVITQAGERHIFRATRSPPP
jgi:hypothetical protein